MAMPTYHPVMELADQKQLQELLQSDQHLARDQHNRTTQILQLDPQELQQQPPSSMQQQLLVGLTEEGADLTELTASNWVQQHSQHSIPSARLQLDSSGVLFAAGGGGPVSVSYAVSSASTDGGSSSSKHLGFFSHYRRKQRKQDDSSPETASAAGEQDASTAAAAPPSREEKQEEAGLTAAAAARPRTAGPACRSSSSDTEEAEQQRVSAADTPARPKTANITWSSAAAAAAAAGDQQQWQWLAFQQQQALGAAAGATAGVPATDSSDARAAARIRQALAGRLSLDNASHRILQASSNGGSGISRSGSSTPTFPAPLEPVWRQLQQQHQQSDYSPAGPEEGGYADAVLPRSHVAAAAAAAGGGGAAGYYDQRARSPTPLLAAPGSPRPPSRSASPFGLSGEATAAAAAATASIQQAMAAANEEMQQLQLLQHLNKERRRLQGVARAAVARAAAAAAASVADTAAASATGSHHGSLGPENLNPSDRQMPVRWDSSLIGGSSLPAPTVGARGRQVSWESTAGSRTGNSSSSNSSGMHANGSSSISSLGVGSLGMEGPPLMGYLGGAAVQQQQQQQYDMLMQQQCELLVQQQQHLLQHNGSAGAAYDMRASAVLGSRPSARVLPVSAQQQHANRSSETGAGSSSRAWDAAWLNAAGASNPAMQRCGSLSPKALWGVQEVAPSSPTAAGAAAGFGVARPRHGRRLSDLPGDVLLQPTWHLAPPQAQQLQQQQQQSNYYRNQQVPQPQQQQQQQFGCHPAMQQGLQAGEQYRAGGTAGSSSSAGALLGPQRVGAQQELGGGDIHAELQPLTADASQLLQLQQVLQLLRRV